MKVWVVRFRYISPDDYCAPLTYLPIEETHIEAETAETAWEKFVSGDWASLRDYYRKEEVYEHPWKKPMKSE